MAIALAAIALVVGLLNMLNGGFTFREKWHARHHHRPDVEALRDIAVAIRELTDGVTAPPRSS